MPVGLSIEVALYFNLKFVLVICVASSSVSTLHFGICNFYEYMKAVVSDEDGLNDSASDFCSMDKNKFLLCCPCK